MYVEYTRTLESTDFKSFRLAVSEREDNLNTDLLSNTQKTALNKVLKSSPFLMLPDFLALKEMAGQLGKFWKPGENLLIYVIGGQNEITKKVLSYAQEWSKHCNINFSVTDDIEKALIRVGFDKSGCWSYIGTDAKGVPRNQATVNFQDISTFPEREFKQVVLHEFGHVLGLVHEHQSPVAKVQWNRPFVYNHCKFNFGWDKSQVDINILGEFEATTIRHSTLDKLSIMGYYIPPSFTLNNESYPQNYELSEMDKTFIARIYPSVLHS